MSDWAYTIIMLVVMVAIFYFLLIRPENKRKKQANELRNSLAVGDEVTTISGVVGTICAVKQNSIVIETGADRVRIELMKWAVSSKGVQTTEDGKSVSTEKK
ncbi:MAG: preprotein translocase subunit YajC [Clostridiales bacterium]|nr:preprotein translocase subunit YajC [Clostridiales bacterium]